MSATESDILSLKPDAVNSPLRRGDLGRDPENLLVFVFGTCNVAEIFGDASLFGARISHMLWQPVETLSTVDTSKFDLGVLSITFRDFLQECGLNELIFPRLQTAEDAEDFLERCYGRLAWYIERFAAAFTSIPVFIPSFLEPSFGYQGILIDQNHPASARSLVRKLNQKLSELIRSRSGLYYIETNEIISAVGRMYLQDDVFLSLTHNSIIRDWNTDLDRERIGDKQYSRLSTYHTRYYDKSYGYHFWSYVFDAYRIVKGTNAVKLVIVDLDDTLWRGVAGEASDLNTWERKEGWPIGFVEALLYFKSRGGMLAICSKNDHDIAARQMEEIWGGQLSLDDFASVRINRRSKVENIREILNEVNILPNSVVFVDDNPREIAEVSMSYPEIRYVSGNHFEWRRILLSSPETQVPVITGESANRTALIKAKIDRDVAAEALPREAWLESLSIELSAFRLADCQARDFARCFELLNKTNQFNTTGKRWSPGEMQEFFDAGGEIVYISLKDKTVDNGIVGVALVRPGRIEQVVLSCRVFGLGAETGLGHFAVKAALASTDTGNIDVVSAKIQETGKNFACLDYFRSLEFAEQDGMFLSSSIPAVPDWIRVSDCTHIDAVKLGPRVESETFRRRFAPKDGKIRSSIGYMKGNALISDGTQGFLMFGPYIALPKGRYQASIGGKFSCTSDHAWIDVCANAGSAAVQFKKIDQQASSEPIVIAFELTEDARELEIRLHVGTDDQAEIEFLEIERAVVAASLPENPAESVPKRFGTLRQSRFFGKYCGPVITALGIHKTRKTSTD
jgi:FkbH-like protein